MRPQNIIFFAAFELYERPAKIAEKLRVAGFKIFLIYSQSPDPKLLDFFDFSVQASNPNELAFFVNKLSPKFVHLFAKNVDLFTQTFHVLNIPFIYDYKDLFEGLLSVPLNPEFLLAQRNMVETAFALTYRDNQLHQFFSRNKIRFSGLTACIPDQVLSSSNHQINYKNKSRLKLCFSGYFTIELKEPHYAGLGQLAIIKSALAQGFEYHMYGVRHDILDKNDTVLADYIEIEKSNSSFKIHDKLPLQDYIEAISQYSFGIHLMPMFHFDSFSEKHYLIQPPCGFAARLTDFVSAGVPLIVERSVDDPARFVEDNGIGIVVSRGELPKLREIVESVDYQSICENVLQLAKRVSSSGIHIDRLIQLYHHCHNN
jgi:hypothetical protein